MKHIVLSTTLCCGIINAAATPQQFLEKSFTPSYSKTKTALALGVVQFQDTLCIIH